MWSMISLLGLARQPFTTKLYIYGPSIPVFKRKLLFFSTASSSVQGLLLLCTQDLFLVGSGILQMLGTEHGLYVCKASALPSPLSLQPKRGNTNVFEYKFSGVAPKQKEKKN